LSTRKPVAMIFYCQRTEVAGRNISRHRKSRTSTLSGQDPDWGPWTTDRLVLISEGLLPVKPFFRQFRMSGNRTTSVPRLGKTGAFRPGPVAPGPGSRGAPRPGRPHRPPPLHPGGLAAWPRTRLARHQPAS